MKNANAIGDVSNAGPYTIKSASERVGCSERYLREAIKNRLIEVMMVGRKHVITQRALDEYMQRITVPVFDAEYEARRIIGG